MEISNIQAFGIFIVFLLSVVVVTLVVNRE